MQPGQTPSEMKESMSSSPDLALKPKCPLCGKPAVESARPFCSKRCADIDLHRWLSERYVIPVTENDPESDTSTGLDESEK